VQNFLLNFFLPFPPSIHLLFLQLKSGGLCKEPLLLFSSYFSYSLATSHMYLDHMIHLSFITNHHTNPLKAPFQPSLRP
jgi:hypothetical protein